MAKSFDRSERYGDIIIPVSSTCTTVRSFPRHLVLCFSSLLVLLSSRKSSHILSHSFQFRNSSLALKVVPSPSITQVVSIIWEHAVCMPNTMYTLCSSQQRPLDILCVLLTKLAVVVLVSVLQLNSIRVRNGHCFGFHIPSATFFK